MVTPPTCEYKCGEKFCSNPLPLWDDEQGCNEAYSACKLQVPGCFMNAGWPNCMNCFDFHEWCNTIKYYCKKKQYYGSDFGKDNCFRNYPPVDCPRHTTATTTYPCKSTPPATPTTSKPLPSPPTPTGYCKQPKNDQYGYNDQKPVGNIWLPNLNCNNVESEHRAGAIFKLYMHQDSKRCSSYKRQHAPDACEAACNQQYTQCKDTYVRGCKNVGKDDQNNEYGKGYPGPESKGKGGSTWDGPAGGGKGKKRSYFEYAANSGRTAALEARTHERWLNDGQKADKACTQQFRDCVSLNRNIKVPKDKCVTYGVW
ncbi:WSC-domain-containing protein [Apiospora phragmitis]|uniref:WSC-domain-containing protein n=1 Tax=Apiospora phragmitis TaxID=2905665 RepID=A0ABR1SUN6_9PEZI